MKKKGFGFATVGFSAGFYGGGDPTHAVISIKRDGSLELKMGTVDIGQGCKTVFTQIAAEELEVPIDSIIFINKDTDITPYDMGSYASRVTFVGGNALIKACSDLKQKMREFAAKEFSTTPDLVEIADSKVFARNIDGKVMSMAELGLIACNKAVPLSGYGAYVPEGPNCPCPETGAQPFLAAAPFGVCIAEIEVDLGTGMIEVIKNIHVYEIGKVINPLICKGQIQGGAVMGIGMALSEDAHPYWPSVEYASASLSDYVIPTAADIPSDVKCETVEVPHPNGPYGAKGFSEMGANAEIPAIAMAVHDAIGVWINQFPITPEAILRALA